MTFDCTLIDCTLIDYNSKGVQSKNCLHAIINPSSSLDVITITNYTLTVYLRSFDLSHIALIQTIVCRLPVLSGNACGLKTNAGNI